jgi:hypothetical protein
MMQVAELQRATKKKDDDLGNAQRRFEDLSAAHRQLTSESKAALDAKVGAIAHWDCQGDVRGQFFLLENGSQ